MSYDSISGAVVPPISLATTFAQKGLGELYGIDSANSLGNDSLCIYSIIFLLIRGKAAALSILEPATQRGEHLRGA